MKKANLYDLILKNSEKFYKKKYKIIIQLFDTIKILLWN